MELEEKYDYRVCAYRITSNGDKIKGNYSTITDYVVKLRAPKGITKTNSSMTNMKVSWTKIANVDGYILTLTSPDDPSLHREIKTSASSMDLDKLKCGYRYVVKLSSYVILNNGTMKISSYATNDTTDPKYNASHISTSGYYFTSPDTPTNVKIVDATKPYAISLKWDRVEGVTGYVVKWSTTRDGTYTDLSTIGSPDTTKYTHEFTAAEVGKVFYFRVYSYVIGPGKTIRSSGSGKLMGIVAPGKTSSVKLSTQNKTQIMVKWDPIADVSGYVILRSTSENGTYNKIKTVSSSITSWIDGKDNTPLATGTKYYYKVRGYVQSGTSYCYGVMSNVASRVAAPKTPATISAVSKSGTEV